MNSSTDILIVEDYYIIKKSKMITVDNLHSRELCSFFIVNVEFQPTSQIYLGNLFPNE